MKHTYTCSNKVQLVLFYFGVNSIILAILSTRITEKYKVSQGMNKLPYSAKKNAKYSICYTLVCLTGLLSSSLNNFIPDYRYMKPGVKETKKTIQQRIKIQVGTIIYYKQYLGIYTFIISTDTCEVEKQHNLALDS